MNLGPVNRVGHAQGSRRASRVIVSANRAKVEMNKPKVFQRARWAAVALCAFALSGCGLAAAPCRVASAGLKIVPLVGHAAAAPTDACAAAIDP